MQSQATSSEPTVETAHIDQSTPYEWVTVTHGGDQLIIRDVPEGLAECFVISDQTRNPRTTLAADAIMFKGSVLEAHYEHATRCAELYHDYAGQMERISVAEWFDEPVLLLERLETTDIDLAVLE